MKNKYSIGPWLIIFAAFLWSLDGFLRQALYSLPASLIVFLEHLLGFLVTIPFLIKFWPQIKKYTKQTWLAIWWVVVFGGILGTIFYTKALAYVGYIDLSVVVFLQKLQPVFAILLAIIILKEKPVKRYWLYAILAFIGGYLVTFKNLVPNFSTDRNTLIAAGLAVLAAFAWGSSTVFGRRALAEVDFRLLTSLRFGLTALVLLPFIFIFNEIVTIPIIETGQWLKLIAIVFSTGLVAIIIYYAGLKFTRASVATICEMFWPISAIILDYFINHKILSFTQIIGGIILLWAIYKISISTNKLVQVEK